MAPAEVIREENVRNRGLSEAPLRSPAEGDPIWHALSVAEVAGRQRTDPVAGLAEAEAAARLARHGSNALPAPSGRSFLTLVFRQFASLIVALLAVAAVIALLLGDRIEAVAILVVLLLNAAIGLATEWKAERTLAALQRQAVPTAHVVRNGDEHQIAAATLVPGDVVLLAVGARVPADGRVIESMQLQVDEAALTGESMAVIKTTEALPDPAAALADRTNMAFMGTVVASGRGRLLVTATGARTEMGQIGTLLAHATERETPLEGKLERLGRMLIVVVLGLCVVVVVAGWLRGNDFLHMVKVGVSLAIAGVPEGLPAVATMTLALGMQRMARMGALVRRLHAVETLGSTTVICTDKTGTLTRNEMTVLTMVVARRHIEVGSAQGPVAGRFAIDGQPLDPGADPALLLALRTGALCNDANLGVRDDRMELLGDPTETALLVVAARAGLDHAELEARWPRVAELPFDSAAKRMVTVHRAPDGTLHAFMKGSPGAVLGLSTTEHVKGGVAPLDAAGRGYWQSMNLELAGRALRVLGLATRALPEHYAVDDLGHGWTFAGLVGMQDPLREEARSAIATCRAAGIRTVMLTGDQQVTAAEIGRQLGLAQDPAGRPLRTVHAREVADLDAAGWQRLVGDAAVFARVTPRHKLLIVEAFQRRGEIVAMTGDGVNDAPALKQADIGVAMGIMGTEVAKEAADMVITDDNFATIVSAVEQGRIIYANILHFIHYLFSCNFAEVLTVFVAIMLGWPLPLAPLQILWLNMLTDVFPALALALEPSAPGTMSRPPRDPRESLLAPRFVRLIAWQGALLAGTTLLGFAVGMAWHGAEGDGLPHAVTIAFMTLALAQVLHAFNVRSRHESAFSRRLFGNGWLWVAVAVCLLLQVAAVHLPLLQTTLGTVPLTAADWALVVACALIPVAVVEAIKVGLPRLASAETMPQ